MARKIILPTTRKPVENYNPRLLVFMGFPKSGKSSAIASLEDNLVIDLENGYRALSVMKIDAKDIYDIFAIKSALDEKLNTINHIPYKYITIDNASRLEEYCLTYAAALYRKTPMASNWGVLRDKDNNPIRDKNGKMVPDPKADVRQLPQGAGYLYLREALKEVIHMFQPYCETLILVCHVKDKQINLNGVENTRLAVDLAGKLADIICGEADAVGYVYREKNKTILSFEGGAGDIREARCKHLRGRQFVIGESDENNNLTMNLGKIFIDGPEYAPAESSATAGSK